MSIADCVIRGTATIRRDGEQLIWDRTDPEIHVTKDLLEQGDPDGLAMLTGMYELGEDCPYDHRVVHARLRGEGTT